MFEPELLTVPQLAARWKQTTNHILEQAMRLQIPLYFAFEGLVFELDDHWRPAGGDALDKKEYQRLSAVIEHAEQTLRRMLRAHNEADIAAPDQKKIKKIRRDIEQAKSDRNERRIRLEGREMMRNENAYHGFLRLAPATLFSMIRDSTALHPLTAFWPIGDIQFVRRSDGNLALEGPAVKLEPLPGRKGFLKEKLTANDVLASMIEVQAIEVAMKAREA